ncbi:cytidine deaminase [Aeromonas veronii]|uniref:cytidine deaminase n=1 Tax=Aeromonas veronii TaxID=654 RepID=UPI001115EC63|nr:cytidine deaminase [Aeromonas veronii]TNI01468.1 cytidine deaminase [Aeromonas veronii]HDO1310167.1 cytidine deaminase [Aeromonas veronii]HDO1317763.1 cytidine deaminase [Aeromonas veronii]HDO1331662.1 cytidine deaminase [Aeromonas veronii]HDO1336321.1 cytidine deaminase [Aeromonas veronii]
MYRHLPEKLKPALNTLPTNLRLPLETILDNNFKGFFSVEQVMYLKAAGGDSMDERALLLTLIPVVAAYSTPAISNLKVGAIAIGESGAWFFGANLEFKNLPLHHSVHAEQSAISNAWLAGENGIKKIAVNYTPCGHCRQFINELSTAKHLELILANSNGLFRDFLPCSFGPSDLSISDNLMSKQEHELGGISSDHLVNHAISAARKSYAPYTKNYAGVAIQFNSGSIYTGRYAENAAFNPSLSPMQMACSQAVLAGEVLSEIFDAVLVETKNGIVSQQSCSIAVLEVVCNAKLRVHLV